MNRTKGSYSKFVGEATALEDRMMKQYFDYAKGRIVEEGERQYKNIIISAYKRGLNDLKDRYLKDNRDDVYIMGKINDYIDGTNIQKLK